ncbi:MAG TPA: tail fiber protein [Dongiaceae bacterium]|nr:tail fiber protein [Dongiaceae bacterium]
MPRSRFHIADLDNRISLPRRSFLARLGAAFAGLAVLGRPRPARAATQDVDAWIGEVALVAFNFAPQGWALCNGQLLPIATNTALFSLLGTTYGGDGQTTFALPDLRSRVPIHQGQGPGLSNYVMGQVGGNETATLTVNQIPSHTHAAMADATNGSSDTPTGLVVARNAAGVPQYGSNPTVALAPQAIASTGGSQPHTNVQPYLTMNYVIALSGYFPSRS